jgi:hypothetical protein
MSVTFKIKPHHLIADKEIVEVWSNGRFLATITPGEYSIRVISNHVESRVELSGGLIYEFNFLRPGR